MRHESGRASHDPRAGGGGSWTSTVDGRVRALELVAPVLSRCSNSDRHLLRTAAAARPNGQRGSRSIRGPCLQESALAQPLGRIRRRWPPTARWTRSSPSPSSRSGSSSAGASATCSTAPWRSARTPRCGASTRGRRPRTASPARTTSCRASSRTSTPATSTHARPSRAPQGRLGLPRAAGRARGREGARDLLEGRDRGLRDRRVQPALPRVGVPLRRGLEPAHRADRVLDRPRRPLRDAHQRLHRVGLVVAAQDLGRRAALRGHKVVPYCPR